MTTESSLPQQIKQWAEQLGFARCRFTTGDDLPRGEDYRQWLCAGMHGGMDYLAANLDKRFSPRELFPPARSAICLAVGYKTAGEPPVDAFVARYARGRDYHKLLKRLAHELCDRIREVHPGLRARTLVDTAPLSERSLAARSGLGWIGRNGSLIVPGWGSYVVLTEILCDLDLPPDPPHPGGCGDCRACLAACPTGAFKAEKLLDARRCLSYHSIENRGEVPADIRLAWGNRVFGCDSCQEVCPQNRLARIGHPDLTASAEQGRSLAEILRWSREDWSAATEGSTRRRATWAMWLRNAVLAAAATGGEELIEPLRILRNRIAEEPELQECDFDLGALIDEAIAKRGGEI